MKSPLKPLSRSGLTFRKSPKPFAGRWSVTALCRMQRLIKFSKLTPGRPGVSFENLIKRCMRHNAVTLHRPANGFGDLRKVNPLLDKGFNGDFIGRVQYRGKCPAFLACASRQTQRGK